MGADSHWTPLPALRLNKAAGQIHAIKEQRTLESGFSDEILFNIDDEEEEREDRAKEGSLIPQFNDEDFIATEEEQPPPPAQTEGELPPKPAFHYPGKLITEDTEEGIALEGEGFQSSVDIEEEIELVEAVRAEVEQKALEQEIQATSSIAGAVTGAAAAESPGRTLPGAPLTSPQIEQPHVPAPDKKEAVPASAETAVQAAAATMPASKMPAETASVTQEAAATAPATQMSAATAPAAQTPAITATAAAQPAATTPASAGPSVDIATEQFRKAEMLNAEGKELLKRKMIEAAEATFKKALEINPQFSKAYNNLGYTLYLEGKIDESVEHYQKAIEYDPNLHVAKINLGNSYLKENAPELAEIQFNEVIAQAPPDPRMLFYGGSDMRHSQYE